MPAEQLRDPIYVAGPMTDLPDKNIPEFNRVADELRSMNYRVENPASLDGVDPDATWQWIMRRGIEMLMRCNTVVLLPGWQRSRGATMEADIARTLGMDVYEWEDLGWATITPFRRPAERS